MAINKQAFIATIAPLIQKYANQYGYKLVSPIIAQACLESKFGVSDLSAKYHNYFGLKCGSSWKGASVNMSTKEEYKVGTLTSIKANFRAYSSMEEGVKGYFDFISSKRYENLKTATTPRQYLERIKSDGFATSSNYVYNNMKVLEDNNLTIFDVPYNVETKKVDYMVKITASSLNLRSSYSENSVPLLKQGLPNGMILKIKEECEGWGKVADTEGWVKLIYTKKL